MEIETNDERIISCHLQKYVDKVEAWRLKQRYEDYLDKFESEEDFEKYVQDRVRKKCLEARAKIERIVMNRTKKRAVTEREKSRVMTQKSSSSISFSPDGQFPYKVLKLGDLSRDYVKSKQAHALPLSEKMEWNVVFENPMLDLIVDVGCGNGRFVLRYAYEEESKETKKHNFLGTFPYVARIIMRHLPKSTRFGDTCWTGEHCH